MVAQRKILDPSSPESVPSRPGDRLRRRASSDDPDIQTVTLLDLLTGIRIPPAHRFAPYAGSERTCAWCGRVERTPDETTGAITYHSDGICLPCLLTVQLHHNARSHRVILLPDRVLDDETLPLRWRVYGYLQRQGAGEMWTEVRAAQVAQALHRQPRTIYRVLADLAREGYAVRRSRKEPSRRGLVREVRLNMGNPQALSHGD